MVSCARIAAGWSATLGTGESEGGWFVCWPGGWGSGAASLSCLYAKLIMAIPAGVAVSRHPSSSGNGWAWSAPCSVSLWGLGWGLQAGAELTDLVLVLRDYEAVSGAFEGSARGLADWLGLSRRGVGDMLRGGALLARLGHWGWGRSVVGVAEAFCRP